ncbi:MULTISPECIES: VOC family protein [unclassified Brevibacterium]|uniref:VOC family protein n=1 Tax=unclassified Brevibacterium TaxID=2614124 RepID=UPI001E517B05|nr:MULTISPECIES: VOC family protein [unclassified Brevibacterium]MCD1286356.1 glyoxalase [Brevibacterium sp. CCUG 69071]MDK8433722.1 VOC family protein [Brevibacterium sp. H-BE7]
MERVSGIGGYFLRAQDPESMLAWYRDVLGIDLGAHGLWNQPEGPTVIATFDADTDYFGSRSEGFGQQQTMLNFRVPDLDRMLTQVRESGAEVDPETQELAGVGRFGWVQDPEGNRIELWQPPSDDGEGQR